MSGHKDCASPPVSVATMAELRSTVRQLRSLDWAVELPAALDELPALAEQARGNGLEVRIVEVISGRPVGGNAGSGCWRRPAIGLSDPESDGGHSLRARRCRRPCPAERADRTGREVLAGIGRDMSNDEIATEIHISPATARTYVSRMLNKLGARDRAQVVVLAYETGLVTPGRHLEIPGRT
jgi:DNA-binding CsgD family transcriptional regulator